MFCCDELRDWVEQGALYHGAKQNVDDGRISNEIDTDRDKWQVASDKREKQWQVISGKWRVKSVFSFHLPLATCHLPLVTHHLSLYFKPDFLQPRQG